MTDKKKITNATIKLDATEKGHRLEDATPEEKAELAAAGKQFADTVTEVHRETLKEIVQPIFDMLQNEDFQNLLKDAEAREKVLMPYIESVLQDPKSKHKYKGITAAQVLENLDIMGRVINPEELTAEILKRAGQRKRAADAREKQTQQQAAAQGLDILSPEKIKYYHGDKLQTTSTKLANEFFSIAPPITEIDGQLTLNTIYTTKGGEDIAVMSYYNFNEKELNANGITSREFTDFDYFVAMTCNNLFMEGNKIVSLTKIWHEMGNPKNPNPQQLQALRKSLIKGMTTIITISNIEVLKAWKIDIDSGTYKNIKSPVMPIMLKEEKSRANGNIIVETVYIYALSPFIVVAEPLNQITTWDKAILRLYPGSRSGRYWRVMRYLMREIAWIRNDSSRAPKITIDHLCASVGDKTRADKQRTLTLTYELLEKVFKPLDYISSYRTDNKDGGIILKYNKDRKPRLNDKN